jgi:hypothetical protein
VLQQVAVHAGQVAALGQETTAAGPAPFAELSADGGATWRRVPFSRPLPPGTTFTALTASSGGFDAVSQSGQDGQRITAWTSAGGAAWTPAPIRGLPAPGPGGSYRITGLAASGSDVTGVGTLAGQQRQRALVVTVPAG